MGSKFNEFKKIEYYNQWHYDILDDRQEGQTHLPVYHNTKNKNLIWIEIDSLIRIQDVTYN